MPRHQTIDKELKNIINLLKKHKAVKNVIVGRSESFQHKHTSGRIRIRPYETEQGFSIDGYTGWGNQRFEVYLKMPDSQEDREAVRGYIERQSK